MKTESQEVVTIGTQSLDAMWAAIIPPIHRGRPAGTGWKTTEELGEILGVSKRNAGEWARAKEREGLVEIAEGRSERTNRPLLYVRTIAHRDKDRVAATP